MDEKFHLPKHLDEPIKIILWTLDEFLLFLAPLLIFMLCFDSPVSGILSGGILVVALKKVKGEQGHHFLKNIMYWYLPAMIRFKKTPPSHVREYVM